MARPGGPRKHSPKADKIRKAIAYSNADEAIALIKLHGINILDGEARTPLIHAITEGKHDIFFWLLSHGADINHQDRNGWTALHFAIQEKRIELAKSLLEHEARVTFLGLTKNASRNE